MLFVNRTINYINDILILLEHIMKLEIKKMDELANYNKIANNNGRTFFFY